MPRPAARRDYGVRQCSRCGSSDRYFRYIPSRGDYYSQCSDCEEYARANNHNPSHRIRYASPSRQRRLSGAAALREARRQAEQVRRTERARMAGTAVPSLPTRVAREDRRFGVEIEAHSRHSWTPSLNTWDRGYDGSLSGDGIEVRSPVLQGEDGFEQLRMILQEMRDAGCTIASDCGLHVHHEVRDVGRVGVINFVESWFNNQDLIHFLVSPSRRSNTYCMPWDYREVMNMRDTWLNDDDYFSRYGRYKAVNVECYPRMGTVEVRQHQGTLSFRKIEAWVQLGQAMIDASAEAPFSSKDTLNEFLDDTIDLDSDTQSFFFGRALQFGMPATVVGVNAPHPSEAVM